MKILLVKYMLIALLLAATNVMAAGTKAEDALSVCVGQGEYADTLQQQRRQYDGMTLEIALDVIEGEFRGPAAQKKMLKATAEYIFSYGRWADREDVSNAVVSYCVRGANSAINRKK